MDSLVQIRSLLDSGQFEAALTAIDSLGGLADGPQAPAEVRVLRMTALNGLGRWQETIDLGKPLLSSLSSQTEATLRGRVHALLGYATLRKGDSRNAESHLRAAIHVATWEASEPSDVVRYQRILAFMFHGMGLWRQARHELLNAIGIADDRELDRESGGLRLNLALSELKTGDLGSVPTIIDLATEYLARTDQRKRLLLCALVRSNYLRITGQPNNSSFPAMQELMRKRSAAAGKQT